MSVSPGKVPSCVLPPRTTIAQVTKGSDRSVTTWRGTPFERVPFSQWSGREAGGFSSDMSGRRPIVYPSITALFEAA